MYLDEPQLEQQGAPLGLPEVSASSEFGAALQSSFAHTSVGYVGDLIGSGEPAYVEQAIKHDFSRPMSEEEYRNSPLYREGHYQPGMTPIQAQTIAAKVDAQAQQYELQGPHTVAKVLGSLVGGAMDPLLYVPFVDDFAPALKVAEIAQRGEVVGNAVTHAANFAAATIAEQPLAYADAVAHGQKYDWEAAVQTVGIAMLGGGAFGGLGAKLGLGIEQKAAGIAKVLDDVGKDPMAAADTAEAVNPMPQEGVDYTPAAPLPPAVETPDLSALPLTDAHKELLQEADDEALRLTGISRALKAGAACYGNG